MWPGSKVWEINLCVYVQSKHSKADFPAPQHGVVQGESTRMGFQISGSGLQPTLSMQSCLSMCLSFLFCRLVSMLLGEDLALQRAEGVKNAPGI